MGKESSDIEVERQKFNQTFKHIKDEFGVERRYVDDTSYIEITDGHKGSHKYTIYVSPEDDFYYNNGVFEINFLKSRKKTPINGLLAKDGKWEMMAWDLFQITENPTWNQTWGVPNEKTVFKLTFFLDGTNSELHLSVKDPNNQDVTLVSMLREDKFPKT